jgi:hypothetical protein
MNQTLMLRIRERAYHIWAANGGETDQTPRRKSSIIPLLNPQRRSPRKAARCFQAEGKEVGFGWASRFVASLTPGG